MDLLQFVGFNIFIVIYHWSELCECSYFVQSRGRILCSLLNFTSPKVISDNLHFHTLVLYALSKQGLRHLNCTPLSAVATSFRNRYVIFNWWNTKGCLEQRRDRIHQYRFRTLAYRYDRITTTKSPSFCMITFSESLINLTALLPQSHGCSYYAADEYWHLYFSDCRNVRAHDFAHSPNLGLQPRLPKLLAPDAGDFVKLIFLCNWTVNPWTCPTLFCS